MSQGSFDDPLCMRNHNRQLYIQASVFRPSRLRTLLLFELLQRLVASRAASPKGAFDRVDRGQSEPPPRQRAQTVDGHRIFHPPANLRAAVCQQEARSHRDSTAAGTRSTHRFANGSNRAAFWPRPRSSNWVPDYLERSAILELLLIL